MGSGSGEHIEGGRHRSSGYVGNGRVRGWCGGIQRQWALGVGV